MSRHTSLVSVRSIPVRLLSILLAGLLSLQGLGAQEASSNSQAPVANNLGANGEPNPAQLAAHSDRYDAAPPIQSKRLGCQDPELRGRDIVLSHRNPQADRWGDITVAQPKIWQFERVSALLDGLLRDVEGVPLGDLTQLDPSQQNGAALKFVQSALEVGVQYDQAAAVNAANTLSSYNALHASQVQQLDQYNNYMQTLTNERDRLAAQYSTASNQVNALQALSAGGPLSAEQQKQLEEALSRQSTTQASLTSINTLISGAGAAPTLTAPPTVTGTSVQGPASGSNMSSSLSGFSDVLKNLPQGVQNNLSTALQSPSYPATKRLDNFVTLLYERLAREISVLQDDLSRDPDNVAFLLQFDVGLYPSKKAKDHVARVEFNLDCPGCKVYSLYPGQSSYNLANYSGSSKRNSFWGNILTLIGFGASASYRRQTDVLQGSLVQSVYTAGFQNGVMNDDAPQTNANPRVNVNANQAEQSFGWYYGAAPFEQLVTPGIRSTFAMITVPRKLIERTEDPFGNTDACLPFHIDAGWASRNDPLAQDGYISGVGWGGKKLATPLYFPTHKPLLKDSIDDQAPVPLYDASVLTMRTSVNLPVSFQDNFLVARRERKLHVLRMEYNTVSEPPDPAANATVVQTTVQTTTQSTNPATGQTTSQTASQTTGTSVATASPAGGSMVANVPSGLDPLPCPKGKCAAMVIKLDRPIDPNLVVTVRGEPLTRIRDWRGRATSVLPAAQSGTDLPANTAGSLAMKQLQQTRSLLESDTFVANTWFPLNSHELLLNISVNIATNQEFPVIQLADPSGSFVIPHDLRRSFTELIINGFRLRPQTEQSVQKETRRENWREDNAVGYSPSDGDIPISSGPYPFSTFLPLFFPEPAPRSFFAVVGETGDDLLIGFLPRREAQKEPERAPYYYWRESKTQVILEDRDMDFAWSLSCDVQGEVLACRMPREEISRVYRNFLIACPDNTKCPGLGKDRQSLVESLRNPQMQLPQSKGALPQSDVKNKRGEITEAAKDQAALDEAVKALVKEQAVLAHSSLKNFSQAYVSTMQLWVEQADAEGKNVFYSAEPVHIGFLPLSDDYWRDTSFKPLEFAGADAESVTLHECNYLPDLNQCNIYMSLLGVRSWPSWLYEPPKGVSTKPVSDRPDWAQLANGYDPADTRNPRCGWLAVPTAALANDPIVFSMEFPPHPATPSLPPPLPGGQCNPQAIASSQGTTVGLRTTIVMPRARLGPNFKQSEIQIRPTPELRPFDDGKKLTTTKWEILIPAEHFACGDEVELPPAGDISARIKLQWRHGNRELVNCSSGKSVDRKSSEFQAWQKAVSSNGIRLYLEIPRTAIRDLPDRVDVVRTTGDGVKWVVATLPNLTRLLLPSRLTLEPLGPTQFALRGTNAEVIDAVGMQSGNKAEQFRAAPGVDFALVTLPEPSDTTTTKPDTSGGGVGSNSSTQITIDTTKDSTGHVKMTTQSNSTPAKAGAADKADATPPANDKAAAGPTPLPPGSYAVIPLIEVGNVPPDPAEVKAAQKAAADAKTAEDEAKKKSDAAKAAPKDAAKQKAARDAAAALTKAKAAEAVATKSALPAPIYMPLTVSDDKGKPLTFTISDTKKNAASQKSTTPVSATCTTPCSVAPCAVACPQVPPITSTKNL